jgi:hypothetical protein
MFFGWSNTVPLLTFLHVFTVLFSFQKLNASMPLVRPNRKSELLSLFEEPSISAIGS